MGCRLGVPFVAADKRVTAAIVGLFGLFPEGPGTSVKEGFATAAKSITVPLLFVFQWDDQLMSREDGTDHHRPSPQPGSAAPIT